MATATNANPAGLAAAIQAGANPQQAQKIYARSQYLAEALRALEAQGGQNIRSPAQLGMNLLAVAIAQRGKRSADAGVAALQRQIAASLFPNDPQRQLMYLVAPGDVTSNVAKGYAPIAARQGETVLNAPTPDGRFTAPVMIHDQSYFGTQTPTGVTETGTRGPTIQEQTGQRNAATQAASQQEAQRHNLTTEQIDWSKIPIELGMMHAALSNANTNVGNLGLHQSTAPTFAVPPGYQIEGSR